MDESIEQLRRAAILATAAINRFGPSVGDRLIAKVDDTADWLQFQSNRDAREAAIVAEDFVKAVNTSVVPALRAALRVLVAADRSGRYSEKLLRAYLAVQLGNLGIGDDTAEAVVARLPINAVALLSNNLSPIEVGQAPPG